MGLKIYRFFYTIMLGLIITDFLVKNITKFNGQTDRHSPALTACNLFTFQVLRQPLGERANSRFKPRKEIRCRNWKLFRLRLDWIKSLYWLYWWNFFFVWRRQCKQLLNIIFLIFLFKFVLWRIFNTALWNI